MQRALDALVADLVSEFTRYLDLACGGELRHASTWSCELPTARSLDAEPIARLWRDWLAWETPLYRAGYAVQAFEEASWPSRNYGGEPWVLIALTLHAFLRKSRLSCSSIECGTFSTTAGSSWCAASPCVRSLPKEGGGRREPPGSPEVISYEPPAGAPALSTRTIAL